MQRERAATRLHLLTTREIQAAGDGDHSDGGGLLLRVRGDGASWVYRFTSPRGRRREMGLGVALRGSSALAGDSVKAARRNANEARDLQQLVWIPLNERGRRRLATADVERQAKLEKDRERWTLARCARDYHERVIEPSRTTKHAAQWIASLENHVLTAIWNKPIADIEAPELLLHWANCARSDPARGRAAGAGNAAGPAGRAAGCQPPDCFAVAQRAPRVVARHGGATGEAAGQQRRELAAHAGGRGSMGGAPAARAVGAHQAAAHRSSMNIPVPQRF
jgi:hypothetical protein